MTPPITAPQLPVLNRPEGVLQPWPLLTASGEDVWYRCPHRTRIRWRDLLVGMARNSRYAGQHHLPVLQHAAVAVALARWALDLDDQAIAIIALHDGSEAYCLDIPKQLKIELGEVYAEIESRWTERIMEASGLPSEGLWPSSVKHVDWLALSVEKHFLDYGWWIPENPSPRAAWESLPANAQDWVHLLMASGPAAWARVLYTALLHGRADLETLGVQAYPPSRLQPEVTPRWLGGSSPPCAPPTTPVAAALTAPDIHASEEPWAPLWEKRT